MCVCACGVIQSGWRAYITPKKGRSSSLFFLDVSYLFNGFVTKVLLLLQHRTHVRDFPRGPGDSSSDCCFFFLSSSRLRFCNIQVERYGKSKIQKYFLSFFRSYRRLMDPLSVCCLTLF